MTSHEAMARWQAWREQHPGLFRVILVMKKARTKAGLGAIACCLAEMAWNHEAPLDLDDLDPLDFVGLALILAGVGFRLAAYGCLRKKRGLATRGVYSLCRHPLYLGSMLLGAGFCVLLDDLTAFAVAGCYFALFYPLTMIWEDVRLSERYGESYLRYRQAVPTLLPLGRFREGSFSCRLAFGFEGRLLIGIVTVMVEVVELMAETLR